MYILTSESKSDNCDIKFPKNGMFLNIFSWVTVDVIKGTINEILNISKIVAMINKIKNRISILVLKNLAI